jgi:hypothetical protein
MQLNFSCKRQLQNIISSSEDVVRKMQEIPYFQSPHHEGEDVVGSLHEILTIVLQEYGHKFGKNIHLRLPSGRSLLVHLKVIEKTCSKVFFEQGWQDVIHVVGLERGDHIIISLKAHLKFHMYVFDGIGGIKKEYKVWDQKKTRCNSKEEKNIDVPHVQQARTQSCNVDELNNRVQRDDKKLFQFMLYVSNFHQILGSLQYILFYKELIISSEQSLDMLMMTNQNHE